jgi:hypothetical protein
MAFTHCIDHTSIIDHVVPVVSNEILQVAHPEHSANEPGAI